MHLLLTHIAVHPHLALLVVFVVALAESLALIGTLVPAGVVMFSAGALIGAGSLDMWTTLAVAALGAVCGDALSYELGRSGNNWLRGWPPFERYAPVMARGEKFMAKHGGKSILLARFFAPVRAVVPLVAGTTQMSRAKFYVINAASALAWAPAHILPGVLFGASLRMAEAVSARLAVILLVLGVLLWLAAKVARIAIRDGLPLLAIGRDRALQWASRRPGALSRLALFLFDSRKPESPLLIALALLLLGGGWAFFSILQDVVARDPLVLADVAIFNFLQDLRIAEMDRIMVVITGLGGPWVALPVVVAVFVWLAGWRCWRTARYWLAVVGFSEVLVLLLKYALARLRPISLYSGVESFSFPSGHATSSIVIYGFLAFLLSRQQRPTVQGVIAGVTAVLIALVGFSRLYLGAHWFSDVAAGLSMGLAWVALAAMAYSRRPSDENLHPLGLGLAAALALLVFGPLNMANHFSSDLARYARQTPAQTFSPSQWLDAGWRELPRQRMEIGGEKEEPLPLQWADSASSLPGHVAAAGWLEAPAWSAQTALLWLTADAPLKALPVLPKYHQGNKSELAFVAFDPARPMQRQILRLWRSAYSVRNPVSQALEPIWYGALYTEVFKRPGHFFTLGVTKDEALTPATLARLPGELRWTSRPHAPNGIPWQTFLILPRGWPVSDNFDR